MTNVSITIRLSPKDIALIDNRVKKGYFTNRSDAIRNSIRTHLRKLGGSGDEERPRPRSQFEKYLRPEKERKVDLHERVFSDTFGDDDY
ncbi:MAG: ribbon-helix-helix protein, CopG family [Thermoplasmata archaeon]|nr:ribbon-helix-helix protein, CopG family [Thermoplasmata archaeon]